MSIQGGAVFRGKLVVEHCRQLFKRRVIGLHDYSGDLISSR